MHRVALSQLPERTFKRRKVGITPAQYRLHFGKLARQLHALAGQMRAALP